MKVVAVLMLVLFATTLLLLPAPAAAFHDQIDSSHPMFEICRGYHNVTTAPAACIEAAQADSQGRIFGPDGALTLVANIITIITAIAATIVIIVGGIMFALSGGNPEQTKKAKDAIVYALVGLAVAAFGQVIIIFVLNRL